MQVIIPMNILITALPERSAASYRSKLTPSLNYSLIFYELSFSYGTSNHLKLLCLYNLLLSLETFHRKITFFTFLIGFALPRVPWQNCFTWLELCHCWEANDNTVHNSIKIKMSSSPETRSQGEGFSSERWQNLRSMWGGERVTGSVRLVGAIMKRKLLDITWATKRRRRRYNCKKQALGNTQ